MVALCSRLLRDEFDDGPKHHSRKSLSSRASPSNTILTVHSICIELLAKAPRVARAPANAVGAGGVGLSPCRIDRWWFRLTAKPYIAGWSKKEVSHKWAANGSISAVLIRIAYRFDAAQMKVLSHCRRTVGWVYDAAVFERKRRFRFSYIEGDLCNAARFRKRSRRSR